MLQYYYELRQYNTKQRRIRKKVLGRYRMLSNAKAAAQAKADEINASIVVLLQGETISHIAHPNI